MKQSQAALVTNAIHTLEVTNLLQSWSAKQSIEFLHIIEVVGGDWHGALRNLCVAPSRKRAFDKNCSQVQQELLYKHNQRLGQTHDALGSLLAEVRQVREVQSTSKGHVLLIAA